MIAKSRTLVLGLGAVVGYKSYGKIQLIHIHFDFSFWKYQNIEFCLPNSSVSKFGKYWIYIEIVFLFTVMILFVLSFLGLLSVWSQILQKKGKCTKEKKTAIFDFFIEFLLILWYIEVASVHFPLRS